MDTINTKSKAASKKHDNLISLLVMMLILAAIRNIPVRIMEKPPPGTNEVSIPLKKSTITKWLIPIIPNGRANRIRPMVLRSRLLLFIRLTFELVIGLVWICCCNLDPLSFLAVASRTQ